MKNIPANLIIEKNKITTTNPWIVLLDINLEGNMIYLCNNNENITFQNRTYTAIPFTVEPTKQDSKGELPTVTLRISNVTHLLMDYMEQYAGGVGATVTLRVVNTGYLSENYAELEMTFDVIKSEASSEWISLTLGAPSPLNKRFPLYRYLANHCRWQYRGLECGYSGSLPSCKKTLEDCRNHGNSPRFGGFIGLNRIGVKLV